MMEHLDEATLNALVDDELAPGARAAAEAHLTACAVCSAELAALHSVVLDVAALPRGIVPARDLLPAIHGAIDAATRRPLRVAGGAGTVAAAIGEPARYTHRTLSSARWSLAAAAVLLVAVSSAVTALLLRPRESAFLAVDAAAVLPAGELDRVEARFITATDELAQVLREQRDQLAPETIRILEENLAIIDGALEEARAALRADPGNRALSEMLMAAYEKKLELLRSAAASVVT